MFLRTTAYRALLAAAVMAGCGGDQSRSADGSPAGKGGAAPVRPLNAVVPTAPTAGDSAAIAAGEDQPCAMTGLWQPCSVVRRLESAGLGPVPLEGAVRQPGLTVEGSALRLGRGELQIFLYADSASALDEAARVEPRDSEPARARGILRPPAVIRSANLVALLFNNNDRQLERVQLALTAGLPST